MDLTLCKNKDCNLKESCLRFKGKSNKLYQSYFLGSPIINEKCDFYYKIEDDSDLNLNKVKEIEELC